MGHLAKFMLKSGDLLCSGGGAGVGYGSCGGGCSGGGGGSGGDGGCVSGGGDGGSFVWVELRFIKFNLTSRAYQQSG